jgi:pimeloyl-ACP methyl ester carboxylesterase
LIRYDARGHGRSKATYDPAAYRWTELAADMLGVADALAIDRTILGGVSMGCATSLHAALSEPERVEALVLVAPPTAWRSRPRQARIYRIGAGIVRLTGLGAFRLLSSLPSPAAPDSVVAKMQKSLLSHLAQSDDRAVTAALTGAANSDLPPLDALRKLDMPVLILAWRYDPVHPVATAEELVRSVPDAVLHVASGLDDIRAWPELIGEFLERKR